MIEIDTSSINCFVSSYHKLTKTCKYSIADKLELPPFHGHLFIKGNINTQALRNHIVSREKEKDLEMPIFTFPIWHKLKVELKVLLKKMFLPKLKEIN